MSWAIKVIFDRASFKRQQTAVYKNNYNFTILDLNVDSRY